MALSYSRLRELIHYDPETGIFTWRVIRRGRFVRPGALAGIVEASGYRRIKIDRITYASGPLALFYMTGQWPKQFVDHINGDRDDNRWLNLREATRWENNRNTSGWKKKQYSPLKGVTWANGKYVAQIKVNYRSIYLGRFDTAEEAHAAYCTAAHRYFGSFAKYG